MKKLWAFIRHDSGIVIGSILAVCVLVWTYGCESQVTSIVNAPTLVSRSELELEVEDFIARAELKFKKLDQQDAFKKAMFSFAVNFMQGGNINPAAIALVIGNILGLGAVIDNVKKRTHINTLKGGNGKSEKTVET